MIQVHIPITSHKNSQKAPGRVGWIRSPRRPPASSTHVRRLPVEHQADPVPETSYNPGSRYYQWPFQEPIDWRYLPYIRPIF